eukprot:XP_011667029.1 PREDICTED: uncharacterized protein LOC105439570 [Strongylocentrotus purpuratus]
MTGSTAWYDRDGKQKNYWGGATVDSGQCACGISGSCHNGHQCNCDANDNNWREDSGYLTDKTTLPVTEMRFGVTGLANEYGYYTLGPLYCKGDESFLVTGRTDFMFIKESHLSGYNNAIMSLITVEECATACVSASSFICRSFDYGPFYSWCYLSEENDLTVDPLINSALLLFVRIMDRIEDPFTDDDTSDQDLCDAGWIRNGNACYQLVESTVDYTTALDGCRNLNDYGDLASVADQDESNFLFVLSRRTFGMNYYWIGFNDLDEEGTWAWTDGSVSSYTNWYSGEPSGGSEHCGVLRWSSDGTWYDAGCSSTHGYICKYPLNTISCAEWKRKGYTSNGYYTIDPDGRNNGVDPCRVYCDMTTDASTGIMTFEHQEANRSLVIGENSPFGFIRNITYGDKSIDQVATGADISGECYQYIKYECHHFQMTGSTAWYVRDGKQKNYWGGATVDSGQCACGISGSCHNGHQCNCDANDNNWREDSGYLTDKTTLPVTEMRFGVTGLANEYGYYTLGPLYCKGDESFLVTGRTDFMFIKERHLTGYNNAVLSSVTVEECATACVSASSFICRSFDYTPSTCYLSEENDLTVVPSSDPPLHLFVRIMDRIEDPFTGPTPSSPLTHIGPTPSSSLTTSSPPKSTSAGGSSSSIATVVGSAVGAIVVIVIVIVLIIVFYKRRRF